MTTPPIDQSPTWRALRDHYDEVASLHLRDLFGDDPDRGARMTLEVGDLYFDYSKNRVTDRTVELLVGLAAQAGVPEQRDAMLRGDPINRTEGRAVLHTALRAPREALIEVNGTNVVPGVHEVLDRACQFAEDVRSGAWTGFTGKAVRRVVNIGIGGSDLGPAMAYRALRPYARDDLDVRFVSNVDGTDITQALAGADAAETLFVIVSKTFSTQETLANATTARSWLVDQLGEQAAVANHFVAVSTNEQRVGDFGINPSNMFGFWDWVGGRYSMHSAVGLSLMIAIGAENFRDFLAGGRLMDEHFAAAPLSQNMPVLLGLLGVWYRNFFNAASLAVLPYDARLERLPAYLQQLDMESSGKRVRIDARPDQAIPYATGPVIWGEPGTNGQHAFFQLLHQGTDLIPCEFIGFAEPAYDTGEHHDLLMANFLAQPQAMAFGKTPEQLREDGVADELIAHRTFPGNTPSSLILGTRLSPGVLGQLVALYEHKVFVQGTIWGINPFDQWGVELGKALANSIAPDLTSDSPSDAGHDPSTRTLISRYREIRGRDE